MVENQIKLSMDPDRDLPVTVVREMWPIAGQEAAFEAAMSALIQRGLEWPGHLGASVIKPAYPGGPYRFLYKFDKRSNLEAWHASDARAQKMETVRDLIRADRFEAFDGLEAWLNLPIQAPHPAKWKTLVVNWLAIFPTVAIVGWVFGLVMQGLGLKVHPLIGTMVVTGVVVPTVAYVMMPVVSRVLAGWLHKA